jgi:hypothetical protein
MEQRTSYGKTMAVYASLIIISLLVLAFIMQLWRADIHVPFRYDGDANMTGEWVKSLIDNGWYFDNRYIGMPEGKNLRDWPMSDNLHYALLKIISLFTNDYAVIINIFFILTFPLVVCASYYVFRKFSISPFLSFIGAFLFSFLQYHFYRNINHIFLSAYYMNPLMVMVILWLFSGRLNSARKEGAISWNIETINPKFAGSIVICCLTAASGIYYAYFSCFFLLIAGGIRSFWQKSMRPAITAGLLIGVVLISGILNITPSILYRLQQGGNPAASARVYHEAELYSLKISDLLLPVTGHRVAFLSKLRDQHEREISYLYRFYESNAGASLGIIGGAGFVFLLIFLLVYRKPDDGNEPAGNVLLQHLSILNVAALLLATTGGFNLFVSHFIRYKIRDYERISIFIAFFSIFAVMILIQKFYGKYIADKKAPLLRIRFININSLLISFYLIMIFILAAGLADQSGKDSMIQYDSVKKKFLHDKQFVMLIERALPPDSMVFQLPYVSYPETKFPFKMTDYDHFRCYLHSTKIRWSYGAMKGRPCDAWQKSVSSKPAAEFIREISDRGFKGIYIDRNGYEDNGERIIHEIRTILGVEPITSEDTKMIFFSLVRPSVI